MNLFDLYAKISIDTSDYEKGLNEAKKSNSEYRSDVMKLAQTYKAQGMDMSSAMKRAYAEIDKSQYETSENAKTASDTFKKSWSGAGDAVNSFASKIKTGLATAAKVGTAAITAASAGIAALTKASIDGYAEYEQLVGGVDTLFKDASDKVQEYANNAYKTAGMSANDYMSTVTSFSASLLQSLGGDTQAAADMVDMAVKDMSDNANKMGTDIDSIVQTYQSLARGNFAMLDNLKLGYGGTKAELERLVDDAEKLTGEALDPSKFGDIVTAIHAVQTEMGITGTTANEAATTIQGSVSAMVSAWKNLVAGFGNENANLDQLIGNFVSSAETAAGNIIPRITQILSGMGTAIQQIAPILAAEIPALISSTLPALVSAGAQLLVGLITGLISALPELVTAVPQIVMEIYNSLVAAGPQLLEAGSQLLDMLVNGVIQGIPAMLERLPEVIVGILNFISNNLPQIASAGAEILMKLAMGIISTIPSLVAQLPQIIIAIVNRIAALMESVVNIGEEIVKGLWKGIQNMAGWIKEKVAGFFSGIVDGAKSILGIHSPSKVFASIGGNMALGIGEGWDSEFSSVKNGIESGLNFSTGSVDFSNSGISAMSRIITQTVQNGFSGDIVINLTSTIDGHTLSRNQYRYNLAENARHGGSLVRI